MKKGYTIHTVSIYDSIEIFGHRFNGLDEIRKAVGLFMRDNREPFQASKERHQPVEGVHVLCNYEPYPTFDEYDAMCENRDYENYYFLDRSFTKEETDAIAAVYPRMSFCKVYEGMSLPAGMPVIYYYGDGDSVTSEESIRLTTIASATAKTRVIPMTTTPGGRTTPKGTSSPFTKSLTDRFSDNLHSIESDKHKL